MIDAFYGAVVHGGESPISPEHLLRVTGVFEELVAHIGAATTRRPRPAAAVRLDGVAAAARPAPLVAVTGARGFLGAEIARALGSRPRHRPRARTPTIRTSRNGSSPI